MNDVERITSRRKRMTLREFISLVAIAGFTAFSVARGEEIIAAAFLIGYAITMTRGSDA